MGPGATPVSLRARLAGLREPRAPRRRTRGRVDVVRDAGPGPGRASLDGRRPWPPLST